jgi:corrinoid protein of di/trimethylamine methyltransferase
VGVVHNEIGEKGEIDQMEGKEYIEEIKGCIREYKSEEVKEVVEKAIKSGFKPMEVMEKGLIKGLWSVVEDYNNEKIWLPEVALSSRVFFAAMDTLEPYISSIREERKTKGKIVIGTVEKDIHSLGKNIVKAALIAANFDVYDLGADVPAEDFVRKVKEVNADIVASSSLMLTSIGSMVDIEEKLKKEGLREKVKTMIGGGPVSMEFASRIGADGYGEDVKEAVEVAERLVKEIRG